MNASLLEPVAQIEADPPTNQNGEAVIKRDLAMLGHVAVQLEVVLGQASTTIDELFALKPGNCLTLDTSLDAPVALHLNGKPIARGHLVAVEDHFGIKIMDIA